MMGGMTGGAQSKDAPAKGRGIGGLTGGSQSKELASKRRGATGSVAQRGTKIGIEDSAKSQVVRPFNGRDFEGWHAYRGAEAIDPSDVFRAGDEQELVWAGNAGRILTDVTFYDVSLKFQYLLPKDGRYGTAYCCLDLGLGNTYRIGDASFAVQQVLLALTNGKEGRTGDVALNRVDSGRWTIFMVQRSVDVAVRIDEWNDIEIRCEGRALSFLINGHLVKRLEANQKVRCHVGFNSRDADIRFRNIRLIPLASRDASGGAQNRLR
jgi:hypothetical protein